MFVDVQSDCVLETRLEKFFKPLVSCLAPWVLIHHYVLTTFQHCCVLEIGLHEPLFYFFGTMNFETPSTVFSSQSHCALENGILKLLETIVPMSTHQVFLKFSLSLIF